MIFTRKDLVSFGQYLLSNERMERISTIEGRSEVHHADVENWLHQQMGESVLKNTITAKVLKEKYMRAGILSEDWYKSSE